MAEQQYEFGWNQAMGMSLYDKIRLDLKNGVLHKQNDIRDGLRVIMGEFPKLTVPITLESGKKTFRVKKPEEITDDDLLGIIRGLVKSEKTVLELQKKETSPYLQVGKCNGIRQRACAGGLGLRSIGKRNREGFGVVGQPRDADGVARVR